MRKKSALALGLGLALAFAGHASAQELDQAKLYVGGGLSNNSLSSYDNASGYQFFAGYDLDLKLPNNIKSAVEVGYMNSGDFKYSSCDVTQTGTSGPPYYFPTYSTVCGSTTAGNIAGLWANYVAAYPVNDKISVLGRAGLDFGDDDGLMYGVGAGYAINRQLELRGEYVSRQHMDSIEANIAYHLK